MANSKAVGVAYSDPQLTSGTVIGESASDLISFHGAAGAAQATNVAAQSINALSVSGVVGFTSSTSLSSVVEKLNTILTVLKNKGLMASS